MATGRPTIPVGGYGEIRVVKLPNGKFRGDGYARNMAGELKRARVTDTTMKKCREKLIAKLEKVAGRTGSDLDDETEFRTMARVWLKAAVLDSKTEGGRRKPQTVEKHERALRKTIIPAIGKVRLGELTVPLLEELVTEIMETGHIDKARKVRSVICMVLDDAVRMGAISDNPARKTTTPPRKSAEPESLNPATIARLREAVRVYRNDGQTYMGPRPNLNLPVAVDMMLGTGLRIGELLALRWCDVRLGLADDPTDRSSIDVNATMVQIAYKVHRQDGTKSRAGMRRIYLPEFAANALRSLRPTKLERLDQPVFVTRNGTAVQADNLRRSLNQAVAAAGMDARKIHPHKLRSTVATLVKRAGYDASVVADLLGHSDEAITNKYYIERMHEAPDVLGVIQRIVDGDFHEPPQPELRVVS